MKTIITAALVGGVTPKSKAPYLPITPKEIAEDAIRVWKAGAAIVHLHMRDDNGYATMDPSRFRETVLRIRETTDLVICLSSAGPDDDEARMAHIAELKPELCSLAPGSFNFLPGGVFSNDPEYIAKLGGLCRETGVKPEYEIFDYGMIDAVDYFKNRLNVLPQGNSHYQFCLGVRGQAAPTAETIVNMSRAIPQGSTWSAFGIGIHSQKIMFATLACGGHLRVGLEDCIWYQKGVEASNTMFVERAGRLITEFGNQVATPDDAREILNLIPGKAISDVG